MLLDSITPRTISDRPKFRIRQSNNTIRKDPSTTLQSQFKEDSNRTHQEQTKMVKYVETLTEFNTLVAASNDKLLVVDFTATW